jgi:uncharacterized phage-associated protein
MTLSAHDVAAVLRDRLPGLPTKKLHKLLYYCQGHHLATFDEPLFGETISAWDVGPVVGALWYQEKSGDVRPSHAELTEAQLNTVGYVLSRYGALTGQDLENLTHGPLADLSPALLEIARTRFATSKYDADAIVEMDARDLNRFGHGEFDAVLSLAPFYHLTTEADRDRAAAEAYPVLLAVVMPRYLRLVATVLERGSAAFDSGVVARILNDGGTTTSGWAGSRAGSPCVPRMWCPSSTRHGFVGRRLMASQGMLGWAQTEVAALAERDPGAYRRLFEMAYETAIDPSILGMAAHPLFVGGRR